VWKRAAVDSVAAITDGGTKVAYGANPPPGIATATTTPRARVVKLPASKLTSLCWLPDDTLVSASSASGIQHWTGTKPRQLSELPAEQLVVSTGGERLGFSVAGVVHLLDLATGKTTKIGRARCFALAPDGIVLVDRTAELC
jgi:hypothetical protein